MAIPSGTGSEILNKCCLVNVATGTNWAVDWTGTDVTTAVATTAVPANHIITVLGIIICEQAGAIHTLDMILKSGGTNDTFLLKGQSIGSNGTFTWNDRFVLHPTDVLRFTCDTSSNFDIVVSFIDQNWI